MFEYPMTVPQKDLIDALRRKQNISNEVMDQLCQKMFGHPLGSITKHQATALITSMKDDAHEIKREIQILAGQRSLL